MRNKRETPTQERLKELFNYDPETGIFTRNLDRRKWKAGTVAGTIACGYISINVDYCIYRAHRLAWRYMTGEDPETGIDHINGIPTDNRFCNLRLANQSENMRNIHKKKLNICGAKGVHKARNGRFCAKIQRLGKTIHLGTFDSIEEARASYNTASKVIHGSFGRPS